MMPRPISRFSKLALGAALGVMASVGLAQAQQVTLTYQSWHLAEEPWATSIKQALATFQEQNPDIKVIPQPISLAQRDVALTTGIRAGQGPDLFQLDAAAVPNYIQNKWVADLTPFMAKEDGGVDGFMKDFYPSARNFVTQGGEVYGIPHNITAMLIVYNKKLFADAGIAAPPQTWEEFRDDAIKLTKATQPGGPVNQWGVTFIMQPAGFDLNTSVVLRGFGADFLTADNKHSALDTPQAQKAFKFIVDLIRQDKAVPPGILQTDADGVRQLMAQGKIGMMIGTTWDPTIVNAINPAFDTKDNMGMTLVPHPEGSDSPVKSTLYLDGLFMNPNTKHPAEAFKLLKFMTDNDRMEKWFTDNTMLSARSTVNASFAPIQQNPFANAVAAEIPFAALLPAVPQWPQISTAFRQNLQAAVDGSKTAEQALADANQQINDILAH